MGSRRREHVRLQDMIGLTPGNLITHLRKLEDVGYLGSVKTANGSSPQTTVALTGRGLRRMKLT